MAEEPKGFDVSTLEGLAKIKAEQQSLRELSQRAAEHREKVTEVYNRVVRDYEARIGGLEDQANKLRTQLREEFAKLDEQFTRARQALDQARFDLQESEFRKEIGEYSAEEFQGRQRAIESSIVERQRELEGFSRLRSRFLELLPLEALTGAGPAAAPAAAAVPAPAASPAPALPAGAPLPVIPATPTLPPAVTAVVAGVPAVSTAPPPVVPLPTPHPIGPPPSSSATAVPAGARPAAAAPMGMPPLPASGIGETMVLPPPGSAIFRMPPAPAPGGDEGATQILTSPASAADAPESFGTIAIPAGAFVEEKAGGAPVTHRLGMLTTIGRTPDNQIVIPSREVSRKHAEVVLGQGGYVLRDLGSPNGTYVNGKKITEHALQEGDRVTLAGVTFVFKGK